MTLVKGDFQEFLGGAVKKVIKVIVDQQVNQVPREYQVCERVTAVNQWCPEV